MKRIGFVSLGSAGTMGHWSMIKKTISEIDVEGVEIYVFSEYDYEKYSDCLDKDVEFVKLPKVGDMDTLAGNLDYRYKEEFLQKVRDKEITHMFFSTFFDHELVESLDVKKYLVSYPIRDTYMKYFYGKNFQKLFDRVFLFNDVSEIPFEKELENTELVEPVLYNKRKDSERDQVLITMGGGGLPSAKKFSKKVSGMIKELKDKKGLKFKVISGAYNDQSFENLPNTEVTEWVNDIQEEYDKSLFVVSEAGYWTVHEMIENQLPGVLVPGKRDIDNQELRAVNWELKDLGFCMLPGSKDGELVEKVEKMFENQKMLEKFSKNSLRILNHRKKGLTIKEGIKEVLM